MKGLTVRPEPSPPENSRAVRAGGARLLYSVKRLPLGVAVERADVTAKRQLAGFVQMRGAEALPTAVLRVRTERQTTGNVFPSVMRNHAGIRLAGGRENWVGDEYSSGIVL